MTDSDNGQWFYIAGNDRKGPYSSDQMKALMKAGVMNRQTLVWTVGMEDWSNLNTTPFSGDVQTIPPEIPQQTPPEIPQWIPTQTARADTAPSAQVESKSEDFFSSISSCFDNYFTFSGRAKRSEFWYFKLFIILGTLLSILLDAFIFGKDDPIFITTILFMIIVTLPGISVSVRRLHDIDRTGWWYLLLSVPFLGIIILIIFWCQPSTHGMNRYERDTWYKSPRNNA
jgi:uncharacterized membrane protein YhaH (DUF805 family)